MAAALLGGLPASARTCFLNSLQLMMAVALRGCMGHRREIFNGPKSNKIHTTEAEGLNGNSAQGGI